MVSLLTRPGCHLCDVVRPIATAVAATAQVSVEEVSILDHPDLLERFGELIPVTLIDGAVHDYWRLDPSRFRAALAARG